jgi:hypothetical protein
MTSSKAEVPTLRSSKVFYRSMTALPLQVRLTGTAVRAYRLKAERSFKSESSLVSIGYQLRRHMRGWSHRHPRQLLVACRGPRIDPALQVAAPCAQLPAGCISIQAVPRGEGRGRGNGRNETILFWRERGSRARCFQNERLYSPTSPLFGFPAQGYNHPAAHRVSTGFFQNYTPTPGKREIALLWYMGHGGWKSAPSWFYESHANELSYKRKVILCLRL